MASVDVGVALLGYGTVGASVNRLLVESADEIERATGHRLRVVRALVRDAEKERSFPPADGVLTTDFAAIRDDPSIDVVAEVMGGLEPAGGYVRELLARRQAGRVREQAARRARGRRALRDRVGGRRAAALRGVRLRGDPGRQGAARVARRRRTSTACSGSSTGRRTSSSRAWSAAARTPRRSPRRRSSATPRPIRPTTSTAPTPRRRWRSSRRSRSARASRSTDVETRGITEIEPAHVAAAADLGMVVRLVGIATLVDDAVDVRVQPAFVERSHPLAAVDGAFNAVMLQGDAIREITLEGPGRRRDRDGVRRRRRPRERRRHRRHRLPPERRVLARARASSIPTASGARRSTSTSTSPTSPACSRTPRAGFAAHEVSIAQLVQRARRRPGGARPRAARGAARRGAGGARRDRRARRRCSAARSSPP